MDGRVSPAMTTRAISNISCLPALRSRGGPVFEQRDARLLRLARKPAALPHLAIAQDRWPAICPSVSPWQWRAAGPLAFISKAPP